jgi:tetratricopeptide (TPR) repeat protein
MKPGDLIADRFELIRLAGVGGMGEVWQAHDRVGDGRVGDGLVALKMLASDGSDASFAREASILAELRHPGIVRYVAHGMTPAQRPYLVMEWLDGEDLSQRLARGRLEIGETLSLLGGVAEALGAAHARGVIHRDLKPSNLFLPDGSIERVKILDFGVARAGDLTRRTQTGAGAIHGTPGYMAPEQARGEADVDARADVFALACVAFECLTGRRAFEGEHAMAVFAKILLEDVPRIADVLPGVPPALDALLQRMLSKDRAHRPQNARELSAELAQCNAGDSEPSERSRPSLTGSEKRMLGVVLVAASAPADAQRSRALRAVVEERGARLESLADGSLVAVLNPRGAGADLAAQVAQCALAMRSVLPDRPMALAMGRGEGSAGLAAEAIDRSTRLLMGAEGLVRSDPGICVDEDTAGLLNSRFELVHSGGSLELRRELVVEEAPRTLLGRVTECVGRNREIAALEAIFAQCAQESVARAVLVTAPAGTGKSRLRNELVARLRRGHELEIWTGRADPMRAGSAFGLIAQMLRQACGTSEGDPLEERQQRLRSRVARHVSDDRQRVTEFLGELIGAPFDDRDSPQLRAARQDAMLLGDQMRRACEDFISAQSRACPVLLVFEDLHWGDLATIKLVDSALRNLRDRPIMVLALARPDEVHDRFPKLWAAREAQEMRLDALRPKASTMLVRQALGDTVSDETVRRIVERSEGNAFYLEELIRIVAEGRSDDLPETIAAMVEARLERLDAGARRILRAASVFGQTFWKQGTSELLGGSAAIGDWLAHLSDAEIISRQAVARFPGDEEYTFRHALLRDGAYRMLTDDDRGLGHRLAGGWLDRMGERDAMVLAEHFELGGDRDRALHFYPRAAEQALEGNDLEGVLARIERGVACGASGHSLGLLRGIQAEAHNWRGEDAEGERRAVEATQLLSLGTAAWYAAAREAIITAGKLGRAERVAEIINAMRLMSADATTMTPRRMALGWGAMEFLFQGKFAAAEAVLEELGASVEVPLIPDARVEAVVTKARAIHAVLQHRAEAVALLEEALAGFEQAGDLRNATSTRVDIAFVHLEFGDCEEAEPVLRRSLAEVEKMNLYTSIPQVKLNLGSALMRLGRLEEAWTMETEAAAAFSTQGHADHEGGAHVYLAMILIGMDRLDEAEASARRAIELLKASPLRSFALGTLATVLLARERPVEGLQAAEEAMNMLRELGTLETGESLVRLAFAEALRATGDARAKDAIREATEALLTHAAKIEDAERRRMFLERIEENARTVRLAKEWLAS